MNHTKIDVILVTKTIIKVVPWENIKDEAPAGRRLSPLTTS